MKILSFLISDVLWFLLITFILGVNATLIQWSMFISLAMIVQLIITMTFDFE